MSTAEPSLGQTADPVIAAPGFSDPPAPVVEQPNDSDNAGDTAVLLGALLSALALAGLGGVAAVAFRRRKRVHDVRDIKLERPTIGNDGRPLVATARPIAAAPLVTPEVAPQVSAKPATPAAPEFVAPPLVATSEAAAIEPVIERDTTPTPIGTQRTEGRVDYRADNRGLPHAGASVALPRERLATPEERRALIERMAAAKPDRANPFRSYRARLHRAKLIEQSIGRSFPGGKSRIDLSQYPMNWPELGSGRTAAA